MYDSMEESFQYFLVAREDVDLGEQLVALQEAIRRHAEEHDFAQQVDWSEIRLGTFDLDGVLRDGIFVPFTRKEFAEIATVNHYIRQRANEVDLNIAVLILPDGSPIPFH